MCIRENCAKNVLPSPAINITECSVLLKFKTQPNIDETQSVILSCHITNRVKCNLKVSHKAIKFSPHTNVWGENLIALCDAHIDVHCFDSTILHLPNLDVIRKLHHLLFVSELRKASHEVKSTTKRYRELQTYILLPSLPDVTLDAHYFPFPLKTPIDFGSTLAVSLAIKIA